MKDYRVTVKVRNNRILRAIELAGGASGGKWCEANGLSYSTVNLLIGLKISPLNEEGALSTTAAKLCDVLGKLPEELWSNDQLYPLEKNFSEMEMSHEQIVAMLPNEQQTYLMDTSEMEQRQNRSLLNKAMECLTNREKDCLRLRFEEGMTLNAAGKKLGVSPERMCQIEAKALRKLRHPKRAGLLADCLDVTRKEAIEMKKAVAV